MQITDTITFYEVLWTSICLPGLFLAVKLFMSAAADLYLLRINKINSIREYAAITTLILFVFKVIVQLMFVLIGLILMTVVNPPSTTSQSIVAAFFMFVSILMDISMVIVEKRRRILVRKIKQIEDLDHKL